ncbi:MarR family transcriptional regulator [Streptomyces sp. M10(2022)]
MAARSQYEELARQLSAIGAVKRGLARTLPVECPGGSAAVLTLLDRHGEMRISRLSELMAVDMSVTSRHVAHVAEHGWIERSEDPSDKRSRILRLTPAGEELLDELTRRTTELFAHNLKDWSDDDLGLLNTLLSRLRDSFACRGSGGCTPGKHSTECRTRHSDEDSHTRTPV